MIGPTMIELGLPTKVNSATIFLVKLLAASVIAIAVAFPHPVLSAVSFINSMLSAIALFIMAALCSVPRGLESRKAER